MDHEPAAWEYLHLMDSIKTTRTHDDVTCLRPADLALDCIQDQWQERLSQGVVPQEENDSAFIFICSHPRRLVVPLAVRQHLMSNCSPNMVTTC